MKRGRFSEEQIVGILKEHEAGRKIAELSREHGVSEATLYGWNSKYGGMAEGKKERMNLLPYLKRAPSDRFPEDQAELDDSVPPGTVIPVSLFPNLKGQSRIQVIDVLPPGEASRRTETWVLRHAPVALAVLGGLIFLLVRIRRRFNCLNSALHSRPVNE